MLIIFDLDDTLIETSCGITPWKLESVLHYLVEQGLVIQNFNDALLSLKRLNASADSARDAISEFLEMQDADPQFIEKVIHFYNCDIPSDMPVNLYEGAQEVLTLLGEEHHLALVTMGRKEYQKYKIEKAGIDTSLFCTISICEGQDKKPYYALACETVGVAANNVCVCGDRVEKDLLPAKELGFKTIHLKQGRGERPHNLHQYIDYQIDTLSELPDIVNQLKENFES